MFNLTFFSDTLILNVLDWLIYMRAGLIVTISVHRVYQNVQDWIPSFQHMQVTVTFNAITPYSYTADINITWTWNPPGEGAGETCRAGDGAGDIRLECAGGGGVLLMLVPGTGDLLMTLTGEPSRRSECFIVCNTTLKEAINPFHNLRQFTYSLAFASLSTRSKSD